MRKLLFLCAIVAGAAKPGLAQEPPKVPREFRGVWVATVRNTDWPSSPDSSTWVQQRELLAILDRAVALKLNAIIFQVRPGADAFYASPYEPWSQFLTGRQGRAPEPPWDPLAFAVDQAHKRGLELHAWFNPYRAAYTSDTAIARNHISRTNPSLVRKYGTFIWMDPGDPEVRRRSLRAITDVVRRYDVDGVHIDDYFYPYPESAPGGGDLDFPDEQTYARYTKAGGKLSRDDWRRENVNQLVEALYKDVHAIKPWVRVGISPFGIWRPGNPPSVKGFDAYQKIYADSRKWLVEGWADYFVPQLYWPITAKEQSYPVLYDWWLSQNTKQRHLWPGLGTYRIASTTASHVSAQEIVDQIDSTRVRAGDQGHVHFNMSILMKGLDSLGEKLARTYAMPALVPATPWLGAGKPSEPVVQLGRNISTGELELRMAPKAGEKAWLWTVRTYARGEWTIDILPGSLRVHRVPFAAVDRIYVAAISRTGVEGATAAVGPIGVVGK